MNADPTVCVPWVQLALWALSIDEVADILADSRTRADPVVAAAVTDLRALTATIDKWSTPPDPMLPQWRVLAPDGEILVEHGYAIADGDPSRVVAEGLTRENAERIVAAVSGRVAYAEPPRLTEDEL